MPDPAPRGRRRRWLTAAAVLVVVAGGVAALVGYANGGTTGVRIGPSLVAADVRATWLTSLFHRAGVFPPGLELASSADSRYDEFEFHYQPGPGATPQYQADGELIHGGAFQYFFWVTIEHPADLNEVADCGPLLPGTCQQRSFPNGARARVTTSQDGVRHRPGGPVTPIPHDRNVELTVEWRSGDTMTVSVDNAGSPTESTWPDADDMFALAQLPGLA